MSQAYISLSGLKTGLPSGMKQIGPLITYNPATIGETLDFTTISGDNTLAIPSGSMGLIVIPPTGNTTKIVLKGSSGDTGVSLHLTDPSKISIGSGQTSLILNVAGVINLEIEFY
jgi:hypothetical protein